MTLLLFGLAYLAPGLVIAGIVHGCPPPAGHRPMTLVQLIEIALMWPVILFQYWNRP